MHVYISAVIQNYYTLHLAHVTRRADAQIECNSIMYGRQGLFYTESRSCGLMPAHRGKSLFRPDSVL